jgi:hypothetical protein
MNSDTEILVSEILAKSGALTKCQICCNVMILSKDSHAEKRAYAMATNTLKDRERGFRGMERKEVIGLVEQALIDAPSRCHSCDKT